MCGVRWQLSHCEGDMLQEGAEELPAVACGAREKPAQCAGGGCKAGEDTGLQTPHGQKMLESEPSTVGSMGTPSGLNCGDKV